MRRTGCIAALREAVSKPWLKGGRWVQGSARVARSSGYPELDDAAMNAVRGMGQVPPPPKRTDVSIAVNFREEKAQGR
ncbi:MAG: energy transducer TonB [Desulfovibrio sp.]|nr:energy transducer TonB [Desulfovibrio sp.]